MASPVAGPPCLADFLPPAADRRTLLNRMSMWSQRATGIRMKQSLISTGRWENYNSKMGIKQIKNVPERMFHLIKLQLDKLFLFLVEHLILYDTKWQE